MNSPLGQDDEGVAEDSPWTWLPSCPNTTIIHQEAENVYQEWRRRKEDMAELKAEEEAKKILEQDASTARDVLITPLQQCQNYWANLRWEKDQEEEAIFQKLDKEGQKKDEDDRREALLEDELYLKHHKTWWYDMGLRIKFPIFIDYLMHTRQMERDYLNPIKYIGSTGVESSEQDVDISVYHH